MSGDRGGTALDLKNAIREARIAQSERADVVVELREAERTRLDLLAERLQEVADGVPDGHDEFALAVLPGDPPRYWVDATSFVMMGRDKRTYRFLMDTARGRKVVGESTDPDHIAELVTRHVAERIVERERALAAGWGELPPEPQPEAPPPDKPKGSGSAWITGLVGFALGMIAGAFLLLAYAWFRVG
jgi:hypothetical protein